MQATTASTQPTAAELAGELLGLMHELMRGSGADLVAALGEVDLSITQWKALNVLADADEQMSVKSLGGCIALSLPAASRTADGLMQRGLVVRREDEEDRRIKRVAITPKGRDVLRSLEAARLAGIERWTQTLADDQRAQLHAAIVALSLDAKEAK